MTGRCAMARGGAATRPAVFECTPSTACRAGGTAARMLTGLLAMSFWFTRTPLRDTGCADANACRGIAVTAPCTLRFA
jgi:hypothetical protein